MTCQFKYFAVQERHAQLQAVGHAHLVGFQLKNYHPGKLPTDLSRPYFELSKGQAAVTQMDTCDLNLWMVGDILLKADKDVYKRQA